MNIELYEYYYYGDTAIYLSNDQIIEMWSLWPLISGEQIEKWIAAKAELTPI